MSASTGVSEGGDEIVGLIFLAFLAAVAAAIYFAWPEGAGLHRYLVTCDEKGEHCKPDLHLRYTVFPEAQRVVQDTVNVPVSPRSLNQCVVVDEKNWRCEDSMTFKGAHDGEWIGQDGLGKDVPRYTWRIAVLRNWNST